MSASKDPAATHADTNTRDTMTPTCAIRIAGPNEFIKRKIVPNRQSLLSNIASSIGRRASRRQSKLYFGVSSISGVSFSMQSFQGYLCVPSDVLLLVFSLSMIYWLSYAQALVGSSFCFHKGNLVNELLNLFGCEVLRAQVCWVTCSFHLFVCKLSSLCSFLYP